MFSKIFGKKKQETKAPSTMVDKWWDLLHDNCNPYLEKIIIGVAVSAAEHNLSDDEKLKEIYERLLKALPKSIHMMLPKKILFNMLQGHKETLIAELKKYQNRLKKGDKIVDI